LRDRNIAVHWRCSAVHPFSMQSELAGKQHANVVKPLSNGVPSMDNETVIAPGNS